MSIPHPLDLQFPLIARTGSAYAWSFLPDSFTNASSGVTYTASSLPSWASFNPSTLTISGTPSQSDAGSTLVTISSSSSLSSSFTLLVSSSPAPVGGTTLAQQFAPSALAAPNSPISSAFSLASTSPLLPGLRVPPGWSFSIGLVADSFSPSPKHPNEYLYYAAQLPNGEPLPSWLTFANDTLTFDGVAPSDPEGAEQELQVEMIVSDVWGFSALTAQFTLLLSEHELALASASPPAVNLTAGAPFSVPLAPALESSVTLDGAPLSPANTSSLALSLSAYPWLTYSSSPPTLSGTPPSSLSSPFTIPLNITTPFATPSLLTNLSLSLFPSAFAASQPPPLQARPGDAFYFPLAECLSNATSTPPTLSAFFSPASAGQWLSLDPAMLALSGTPPANLSLPGGVNITLAAVSQPSNTTSTTTLQLLLATAYPSPADAPSASSGTAGGLSTSARTALLVLGVLAGVALLLVILLLLLRRACAGGHKVRKSTIGKAYVLDPPEDDKAHEPDLEKADDMGRLSVAYTMSSDGDRKSVFSSSPSPSPSPTPQPAEPAGWWGRVTGSAGGGGRAAKPTKWDISKPILRASSHLGSRASRKMSRSAPPHPGQGMPPPRGILLASPHPGYSTESPGPSPTSATFLRLVPPQSPSPMYSPTLPLPTPENLERANRNPFEGYGYAYGVRHSTSHTHMTPDLSLPLSRPPPTNNSSTSTNTNPFTNYSNPNIGRTPSWLVDQPSQVGASNPYFPVQQPTFTSSDFQSRSSSNTTGRTRAGEREPPRRRPDFGPGPGSGSERSASGGTTRGSLSESASASGEEEEAEEGDSEHEHAVIGRAAVVPTATPKLAPGEQKRPRLVAFTSEHKGDVASGKRLTSQKAFVGQARAPPLPRSVDPPSTAGRTGYPSAIFYDEDRSVGRGVVSGVTQWSRDSELP